MKNFLQENWFKLGILVVLLLVGWAIYTALVVEPERQRAAAEFKASLEQTTKQAQETERQKNLDACLADASTNYSEQWYRECKSEGKLSNQCIDIHELTFKDYLAKYDMTEGEYRQQRNITSTSSFALIIDYISRSDDECSCRLLLANADRIDQTRKDAQDSCYKRYQ